MKCDVTVRCIYMGVSISQSSLGPVETDCEGDDQESVWLCVWVREFMFMYTAGTLINWPSLK